MGEENEKREDSWGPNSNNEKFWAKFEKKKKKKKTENWGRRRCLGLDSNSTIEPSIPEIL